MAKRLAAAACYGEVAFEQKPVALDLGTSCCLTRAHAFVSPMLLFVNLGKSSLGSMGCDRLMDSF